MGGLPTVGFRCHCERSEAIHCHAYGLLRYARNDGTADNRRPPLVGEVAGRRPDGGVSPSRQGDTPLPASLVPLPPSTARLRQALRTGLQGRIFTAASDGHSLIRSPLSQNTFRVTFARFFPKRPTPDPYGSTVRDSWWREYALLNVQPRRGKVLYRTGQSPDSGLPVPVKRMRASRSLPFGLSAP